MENGKSLSSNSREKEEIAEYSNNVENKNESRRKVKSDKPSMIPVIKNDKVETKTFFCKRRPTSSKSLSLSKAERQQEDFNYKLKVLMEKEKEIQKCYLRIEEMIQKSMNQKRENKHKANAKNSEESCAKKMTSDPSVFSKSRLKSEISDFENNIQQISKIWLKTTSDLTSTIRNLKSNSSVNPMELQMENIRIQLAIKQAKSLTLVKTRSVIAEAKKLFRNREIIRSELESLLHPDNLKNKFENNQKALKGEKPFSQPSSEEQGVDESGDSLRDIEVDSLENIKESADKEDLERPGTRTLRSDEENMVSDEIPKERVQPHSSITSAKIMLEVENLKKELGKKNKTITNLNKKIFDLQKTCNENSAKYNQLQVKLFEFHEKIQWNQVLWKQIGKLKERIKGLQQTNMELEFQKKQLECKIVRREQEIDRLLKMNHILQKQSTFQKKQLLDGKETLKKECKVEEIRHVETVHEKYFKNVGKKVYVDEKIIAQKQNAVNQLKKILNAMKDQENFAQKQICMFQSRIEDLEKNGKA